MKILACVSVCLLASSLAGVAHADLDSPAGLWKTIDDKTGKERSLVRIVNNDGVFEGRVEQVFSLPGDDPSHLCKKCGGERKDQPIIGMTFLWGLKKDGDQYSGGEILDPKTGTIYRAKMKVIEGGRKLEVRGYIGWSLFGRSQTWLRQE